MSNADFEYLGPYHVDRVLGRGGMGTVYKGIHSQSGQAVAIKLIAKGIANQSRFRRRFAAEVEALKRLKHPNIVELLGYGEEKGVLFYTMEFVDGRSLQEDLRSRETIPWQEVVQIGIETTAALKHAHNIGIVHRDLKPANLMLNKSGQIKLTDFGISKLFGSTDETAAGAVIGTADFMPPEQAEGKLVNARSDLYSLGCVMYALLAGSAPFSGKSIPEVLYAVRYHPLPSLATRVNDLPADLVALIHELLEKDPLKRPPTALVVGNRLKALQQGMQHKKLSGENRPKPGTPNAAMQDTSSKHLTSLDLSDVDDNELKLTGAEHQDHDVEPNIADTSRGEGLGTHDQPTQVAADGPVEAQRQAADSASPADSDSELHSLAEPQPADSSPANLELETSHVRSLAHEDDVVHDEAASHYTPVSPADAKHSLGDSQQQRAGSTIDWPHVGSVVALAAVLLGSIGLGWWLLQPTSADQLYVKIVSAADSGDDGRLLLARPDIDEFLARFPQDPRHEEVQLLANESELSHRAKLLQRRAARSGDGGLNAIEQAFLDCLQARAIDADEGQQKFESFLAVFGKADNLDENDQRLVELARFASRLDPQVALAQEPTAKLQLEKLIESAERELNIEDRNAYLRELLLLYDGKPWASEQLARIRLKLKSES